MTKTGYDVYKQTPRYDLPEQARALRRDWWTTSQAARAWGVSTRTARRYFEEIGETLVLARNTRTARVRVLHCVAVNTLRPPVRRGNPNFHNAEYQKANSAKRWDGHITRAQRKEWQRQYEAAAMKDLAEEAAQFLPPDDDDDDMVETWEPEPTPEEEAHEPLQPFFLMRWEQEAWERKQKRNRVPRAAAAQD